MDFCVTVLCLLCLTVCPSSEQTASTTANTHTLTPALDSNRLTSRPSISLNPQAVTETTSEFGTQTSGLEHVQLNPPSMTSSDYSSSSVTSSLSNGRTNIPERGSDVMVTSASSSVPVSGRDYIEGTSTSSNVDNVIIQTLTSEKIDLSTQTSVVTSAGHMEVTSSFTFEPPSLGVVQPSTSHIHVPGAVMTSVTSMTLDVSSSSIAGSPIIPTSSSSHHEHTQEPVSATATPQPYAGFPRTSELSSFTSSNVVVSSPPQTSIQGAPLQTTVQGTSPQTTVQQILIQQQSTSSLEDHDSSVLIVDVSSGWGRFLDQRTQSQVEASSHSVLSSQIPVLAPTSSLVGESSSISGSSTMPTQSSVQIPGGSSAGQISSTSFDVSSVRSPMSTEGLESSTPLTVVQTSSMVESTLSNTVPRIEISTSSPPEHSEESVYVKSTTVPVLSSTSSSVFSVTHTTSTGILHVSTSSRETTPKSEISGETTHVSREASHVPVAPTSTLVPPVAQRTNSDFVMPSTTETSTSTIYPGLITTTKPPSTTDRPITSPQVLRDCFFKLTFDVDCAVILNNSLVLAEFVGSLKNVLVVNLQVPPKKIKLYDPLCGSLIIHVAFTKVSYYEVKHLLYGQFQQQQFEVPIMVDNQLVELKGVKVVEIDPPSTLSPIEVPDTGLDKIDLIVIIVACCICGILITIGVILCAKECYRRKYAQSFDLLEVPHVNLKLEDFTLTRIPRPKAVYGDESVTMQAFMDNSSHRIVKSGHPDNHGNGIHSNDVHVRMKQNKDGLVVGVTGYTSQKSGGDRSLKRNSSEGFDPGDPATENLLQKDQSSTQVGANNPIFVDDESLSTSAEHQTKKD